MSDTIIYPLGEDTGRRIAQAIEALAASKTLEWDETNGRYTDESVVAYLAQFKNGLSYGLSEPLTSAVACTKLGANAGIQNPTPGYVGVPAIDPYTQLGPFAYLLCNGVVDADGSPHVTAIQGDGNFALDGTNGNVWNLHNVIYYRTETTGSAVVTYISDTKLSGMSAHPKCYKPNGGLRPFMLTAVYPLGQNPHSSNAASSISGVRCRTRDVSHNALITICGNASTGYSGKSTYDDWYVKTMFKMKYATKDSQSVFAGCSDYNLNYAVTVAETGTTRVIISKANAANLPIGSSVSLGSSDHSNSVLSETRILSISDYDANNSAVYLDVTSTFTTTTSLKLSTGPWFCGCLDAVEGDGAISQAGLTNGKEPFKLQGIELMHGATEVLGDVIISNDGTNGWIPYVCKDSRKEATSVTSDYVSCGVSLPTSTTDGWKYPLYAEEHQGLIYGSTTGGSQTVGMCDGHYTQKLATTGTREWRGLGDVGYGGNAGLWCVHANSALTYTSWTLGGRLSATGRAA